ncbi:MAG TPA: permease, partial [Actinomycetota bacterium]|nr:permease [Actinomycetota bacterium]
GLLAVALAVCSEADAFVAASLRQFPLDARLVFLVVGPAVDVKLIALQAGGWLVVGAMAAASLQTLVPRGLLDAVADNHLLAVVGLGLLAVALAVCSEADAFVAASLRQFPLDARLVFLVVGPVVDVKLIAMQVGMFGRRFAVRFAPLTFVVAVVSAVLVGRWLL